MINDYLNKANAKTAAHTGKGMVVSQERRDEFLRKGEE